MVELSFKEQRKKTKQEARARFQNPYKEGDILHHSWGYDQTNCDFYQVVEVKPASVALRKIGTNIVPGSEGFMSESRLPEKDAFVANGTQALTKNDHNFSPENPTITKRVSFYVKEDGTLRYYIPVPYGWCDLWEGKPQYSSHYA
ncbi:MAG: hypothetical protein Q8O55_01595 [Dehalococcoidales bacterium]|nr:hypothetical protein [Dehalococcoidales bacterium]